MKKSLISLLLIAFLIGSCAPTPASPTPPMPATATQTIGPSETPLPTQTESPTARPYPPLQIGGPYLLRSYFNIDFTNKSFVIMDPDGGGREYFELPQDGYALSLEESVSPDGKWLAYYTGVIEESPYDLALNLYNLVNQTTFLLANLAAPGFPENLKPTIKEIDFSDFPRNCSTDVECQLGKVEFAFRWGIRSLKWSPDSMLLAFAAQIDGPSSDIYIFNVEDQSIKRLTNKLENIWSIDWSLDGEKIIYMDAVPGTVDVVKHFRVANSYTQHVQNPKQIDGGPFWLQKEGWLDESSYLIWNGGDGASPHRNRYIDTDTFQFREIWPYTAETIIVDKEKHQVLLATRPSKTDNEHPEEGVYFVSSDGTYTKISVCILLHMNTVN